MRKYIFIILCLTLSGCAEKPCPCSCENCGIECRNRCEDERCIIGESCCEKCDCWKKPPIKK